MTSVHTPTFAKHIRAIRRRYTLSQLELAQHLGVSRATVNRWEAGYEPSRLALQRLSQLERRWARMEREYAQSTTRVCSYWHDHPAGDPSFDDCEHAAAIERARLQDKAS